MVKTDEVRLLKVCFFVVLFLSFVSPVFSACWLSDGAVGKCSLGDYQKLALKQYLCVDGFVVQSVGELGAGCGSGFEVMPITSTFSIPAESPVFGGGLQYAFSCSGHGAGGYEKITYECYDSSYSPPSCVNYCTGNYRPTGPNCECECVISESDVSDCQYVNPNTCEVQLKDSWLSNSYSIECGEDGASRIVVHVNEYLWSPIIGEEVVEEGVIKCIDTDVYPMSHFDIYRVIEGGIDITFFVSSAWAYEEQFLCSLGYESSMSCEVSSSWDYKYEIRPSEWWGRWESFFVYCESPGCVVEFDYSSMDGVKDGLMQKFPLSLLVGLVNFFDFEGVSSDELVLSLPYVGDMVIHFPDMAWFRGLLMVSLCVGVVSYFFRRFM